MGGESADAELIFVAFDGANLAIFDRKQVDHVGRFDDVALDEHHHVGAAGHQAGLRFGGAQLKRFGEGFGAFDCGWAAKHVTSPRLLQRLHRKPR